MPTPYNRKVASAKDLEQTLAAIQAGLKDQKKRPNPESTAGRWYRIWLNDEPSLSPGEFNALPEKFRRYIHDIETRLDPAGNVKQTCLSYRTASRIAQL